MCWYRINERNKKKIKSLTLIVTEILGGEILELRGRNLATYIPVTMKVSKVFFFLFGKAFKNEQFKKK